MVSDASSTHEATAKGHLGTFTWHKENASRQLFQSHAPMSRVLVFPRSSILYIRLFSDIEIATLCVSRVRKNVFSNYSTLAGANLFSTSHLTMRPSLPRLVRVLPRSAIAIPLPEHGHTPPRIYEELPKESRKQPSFLEFLLKEKEAAGPNFPPNIRIEPVVSKKTFGAVKRDFVAPLKAILRER